MTVPQLSIVVVVYDMEREGARSLYSLSPRYQHGVAAEDYEVIVVDNGSPVPFQGGRLRECGPTFSYHYFGKGGVSPAAALNFGVRQARAPNLGILIDGARILTPGVLRYALQLPRAFTNPVGLTLGWHLGPDLQTCSIERGYDAAEEDRLLAAIGWPTDGYRLFEIAALHHPLESWLQFTAESPCTFLSQQSFERIGGFDERFTSVGGGFIGHDFLIRLVDRNAELVMILGEGTFHQCHGGATSGVGPSEHRRLTEEFHQEYRRVRGHDLVWPMAERPLQFVGHLPPAARPWLAPFATAIQPEVMARDEQLRGLHREVARHHRTIEWLHAEIGVRDEMVARLHREVAHRDATVERLHAEVGVRDETVAWLHREVAHRDATVKRLSTATEHCLGPAPAERGLLPTGNSSR